MNDTGQPAPAQYVFSNEPRGGTERFAALADLYDAATMAYIAALGIGRGTTCLEVGAGGGSIARLLAEHVAPGRVTATDVNPSLLESLALPGVDVQRHNVAIDPLPEGVFDLVHARLVLMHLPNAPVALARMASAVRPGGWLIVEEFESAGSTASESAGSPPKTNVAFRTVLERAGIDLAFGRRLPMLLRSVGLSAIGGEARASLWTCGSAGARLMRANYVGLRNAIEETGLVNAIEFERDVAALDDTGFITPSPTLWSVWGRKPG